MPPAVNSIARVLGFAWVGVAAFAIYPPDGPAALVVQAAGYAVAALAVGGWTLADYQPAFSRRRAWLMPVFLGVLAVAAGCVFGAGSGGIALVVFGFVAAMAAGAGTSLAAALAVTAAGVLANEICGLAFGGSYGVLLGLPAVVASGLLIGRNRAAYRIKAEQSAALLAQREQLDAEQRRADLLDERARIAREIHDVLAHSLGALSIQIQAARSVLADHGDVERAGELLAAAQRMTTEGLTETRRAVQALRADTLPLARELARTTGEYAERYQVTASFDTGGEPRPAPPDATVAFLRVAQEALVNAAKHAPGQPVSLRLDYAGDDVRLTVRNDVAASACAAGREGVRTADAGYGLTGMSERLRLLGGTLTAGPYDGQWVVTAALPLAGRRTPAGPETLA